MAKKDQKQARGEAQNLKAASSEATGKDISGGGAWGAGGLTGQISDATSKANEAWKSASSGFGDIASSGGYDPDVLKGLRSNVGRLADTGGYDQDQLASLRKNLASSRETGGFDPAQLQKLRDTGGYDPDQLASIRSGYKNFADTGGFSDAEKANFRTRATSGVDATYGILQQEAERRRALTGGMGGGGETAQMARQLSQTQAQSSLNAEDDLASQIRTGKLAGLGGTTALEGSVAGNRAATEANVASGNRDILGQTAALEGNVAGGIRSGVGAQSALEGNVAANKITGTQGMAGLYNSASGQITAAGQQVLARLGIDSGNQQYALSVLTELSKSPGILDNILKIGSAAAGAVGGAMGAP
jgi:hypothetical protein